MQTAASLSQNIGVAEGEDTPNTSIKSRSHMHSFTPDVRATYSQPRSLSLAGGRCNTTLLFRLPGNWRASKCKNPSCRGLTSSRTTSEVRVCKTLQILTVLGGITKTQMRGTLKVSQSMISSLHVPLSRHMLNSRELTSSI